MEAKNTRQKTGSMYYMDNECYRGSDGRSQGGFY